MVSSTRLRGPRLLVCMGCAVLLLAALAAASSRPANVGQADAQQSTQEPEGLGECSETRVRDYDAATGDP